MNTIYTVNLAQSIAKPRLPWDLFTLLILNDKFKG